MSVHYFTYDGRSSESLPINEFENMELTFGYFDAVNPPLNMGRTPIAGSLNKYRLKTNSMGATWNGVLAFDLSIVKSFCHHDESELFFTEDEVDYINTWLTSPEYPKLLHIYETEEDTYLDDVETYSNLLYLKYDYFGIFTDIQPQYINGQIIGLTATFTTNSPFAWTQEKSISFSDCTGSTDITTVIQTSESYGNIYPLIEIKGNYSGDPPSTPDDSREEITITNNDDLAVEVDSNGVKTTPRSLTLHVPHTAIYIDCEKTTIYDIISAGSMGYNRILDWEDLGLTDISYIYWPRLFNGENHWTITGNCDITLRYREPRKVGAY